MAQTLHQGNNLNVVLARIPGKRLHFFHAEGARRRDFRMTGVSELVLPFPDQGIDLVVCQGADELPDILGLVLVVLGVVVDGTLLFAVHERMCAPATAERVAAPSACRRKVPFPPRRAP